MRQSRCQLVTSVIVLTVVVAAISLLRQKVPLVERSPLNPEGTQYHTDQQLPLKSSPPQALSHNPIVDHHEQGNGQSSNRTPRLVVMGTARNIARHNATNIATIRRVAKSFHLEKVIIFENDSGDKTLPMLRSWQPALGVPVDVITETKVRGQRTERIAHARNALLLKLRAMSPPPDYVLMLDLDGVNDDLEGVDTCLKLPDGWGACCANQRGIYYDIWALRTFDNWVNCDVWYECTANRNSRFRHVESTSPPIKVKSCFGGAAMYNVRTVNSKALYSGLKNGHEQCEHVAFSMSLGAPLYIQPTMLNTAPKEHVGHLG